MPFLTINGLTISVAVGSMRYDPGRIGLDSRGVDGSLRRTVLARKPTIEFTTTLLAAAEARALTRLIEGEGHHWSFEDSTDSTSWQYSSKGLGYTSVTATPARSTAQYKFGAASLLLNTGEDVTWATALGSAWTVLVWRRVGTTWAHYAETSTGLYYADGSATTQQSWFAVASGSLTLANASGADVYFDDLVALPFVLTAAQLAAATAGTAAWGAVPRLAVDGDALDAAASYVGAVTAEYEPFAASTGWEAAGRRLSVKLEAA